MPDLNVQLLQRCQLMQDGHKPVTGLAERLHTVAIQLYYTSGAA